MSAWPSITIKLNELCDAMETHRSYGDGTCKVHPGGKEGECPSEGYSWKLLWDDVTDLRELVEWAQSEVAKGAP